GKILRIDVNGASDIGQNYLIPPDNPFVTGAGRPEIFAYGFRNPYRLSFDISESGKTRLFVGDVGQATVEEVDIVEAGKNYGWSIREGTSCFNSQHWDQPLESCAADGLSDPIIAYRHAGDLSAVIGGMIYRGSAIPELREGYIFGDWGRGKGHIFLAHPPLFGFGLWSVSEVQIQFPENQKQLGQLLDIGRDEGGELYLLTKEPGLGATGNSGTVYKLIPAN